MSGLIADARTMVDHARVEAQAHRFTYDEAISVESVTQAVCDLSLRFGEDRGKNEESLMSRPFGVALLLGGVDENGPHLFHTDPSGTFSEWTAKAIGAGDQVSFFLFLFSCLFFKKGAQTMLQEQWSRGITLVEAETLALSTLKEVMEEKITANNVEIASITKDRGFRVYTKQQLNEIIERLPAATFE